ncbi:hypothetical protein ABZ863_34995 [Saccharomonospora sp. NPDC046836]|uniref:hypothetical protein n=1 Tax=Saccharomonospora sp. NPDC046836 TaxID=3156921 RepID=UPI0033DA053F
MTVLLIACGLLAGYGLGRWRPYDRLADWVEWQIRIRLHRWNTRPREFVLFALLALTDPLTAVYAWRHRHDPPRRRSPAMVIRTEEPQ